MSDNLDKNHFLFLKELVHLEEREEFEQVREEFTSLSPSERELRGKALLGLRLDERHFSPAGHFLATFTMSPISSVKIGRVALFSRVSVAKKCPAGLK